MTSPKLDGALPTDPTKVLAALATGATVLTGLIASAVGRGRAQGKLMEKVSQLEAGAAKTDQKIDGIGARMDEQYADLVRRIEHVGSGIGLLSAEQIGQEEVNRGFRRDIERLLDAGHKADPRQHTIDHLGRRHEG